MSSIEFIPNWIYTFLIVPLIVLFKQQFSFGSRITVLEKKDKIDDDKIKKVCDATDKLATEVNQMLGAWKEHLRKPNSS